MCYRNIARLASDFLVCRKYAIGDYILEQLDAAVRKRDLDSRHSGRSTQPKVQPRIAAAEVTACGRDLFVLNTGSAGQSHGSAPACADRNPVPTVTSIVTQEHRPSAAV
jgi:hypothetical protein